MRACGTFSRAHFRGSRKAGLSWSIIECPQYQLRGISWKNRENIANVFENFRPKFDRALGASWQSLQSAGKRTGELCSKLLHSILSPNPKIETKISIITVPICTCIGFGFGLHEGMKDTSISTGGRAAFWGLCGGSMGLLIPIVFSIRYFILACAVLYFLAEGIEFVVRK